MDRSGAIVSSIGVVNIVGRKRPALEGREEDENRRWLFRQDGQEEELDRIFFSTENSSFERLQELLHGCQGR